MGTFNALVASTYAEYARRVFGEDIDLSSVAPELLITVDLFGRIENWRMFGGAPFGGFIEQAALAANFSYCGFKNPLGSGLLCLVEIVLHTNNANIIRLGSRLSGAFLAETSSVPARLLDRGRAPQPLDDNPLLPMTLFNGTQVADPIAEGYARLGQNVLLQVNHVIPPGVELIAVSDVVNQAIDITVTGRCREMKAEEKVGA